MTPNSTLEVEEKFWLPNDEGLNEFLLGLGYLKGEIEEQCDTYFSDSHGQYIKQNTCLRIRKNNSHRVSLDYKGPSANTNASTISKVEKNLFLTDDAQISCTEFLEAIGFFKHVVVHKKRLTYSKIYNDLRYSVAVDKIVSLGNFVELEITTPDYYRLEIAIEALSKMREQLSKFLGGNVSTPYRDLVAKKKYDEVFGSKTSVIAFDLDGTIIPCTNHIFYSAWDEISREQYGLPLDFNRYLALEVHGNEGMFDVINKQLNLEISKEAYFKPIYERYDRKLKEWVSLGGLSQLFLPLELLHGRYRLALVTHSKRSFVFDLLDRCDAARLFDLTLCREDLTELKPAPNGYLAVASYFRIEPSELLVVEDSVKGFESAISAGAKVVVVSNEQNTQTFANTPTIESCAELAFLSLAESIALE